MLLWNSQKKCGEKLCSGFCTARAGVRFRKSVMFAEQIFSLSFHCSTRRIFLLRPTQDNQNSRRRQGSTELHGIFALIVYAFPQPSTLRQLKDCYKTKRFFCRDGKYMEIFFSSSRILKIGACHVGQTQKIVPSSYSHLCVTFHVKTLRWRGHTLWLRKIACFCQPLTGLKLEMLVQAIANASTFYICCCNFGACHSLGSFSRYSTEDLKFKKGIFRFYYLCIQTGCVCIILH